MTGIEHSRFASPLTLLDEWRGLSDGPALREFLLLGYTHDLPFLERFAIPTARQLGARVTVLADGAHPVHEPVDVRHAGRAYVYGAAAISRAFHPKLAVLLGDNHIWIAIGSGNPTMAGWGHNHELWAILRGTTARGLRAQADLAGWLSALPDDGNVRMPTWVAATVRDIGSRLHPAEVDESRPDVRLLHNLVEPIVDQLPDAANSLALAAPFIDASGAAVRAVVERVRPRRVEVAVQRDLTSFDGGALLDALSGTDIGLRWVHPERTMHGKLLEFTVDGSPTTAVVGSPNLTSPAMLRTVRQGGNCELALTAPVANSLMLPGSSVQPSDIAGLSTWRPRSLDSGGPALWLLGALRTAEGLTLELICPETVDVAVETSPDGSPGLWREVEQIAAAKIETGTTTATISVPEGAGAAIRLVATLRGKRVVSLPRFVTDMHRCRPRMDAGDAPALPRTYTLDDLFSDRSILERFQRDLDGLLDLTSRERAPVTAPLRVPAGTRVTAATNDDDDAWTRLMDQLTHSFGSALVSSTFPGVLPSPESLLAGTDRWAVTFVEDESELAEGETEDAVEHLDPGLVDQAPPVPARYLKSWTRRLIRRVDYPSTVGPSLPERMIVARLVLGAMAEGAWGTDESWREDLARVIASLVAGADDPPQQTPQLEGHLGSLVAVCLTLIGQDAHLHGGRPVDIVFQRAWESAHHLASVALLGVVRGLLGDSTSAHARLVGPGEVEKLVELAQSAAEDPLAKVKAGLDADGIELSRSYGCWITRGRFRNPIRIAARIATDLDAEEGVVSASANERQVVVIVRRGPEVAILDSKGPLWRLHTMRPRTNPATFFGGGDGVERTTRRFRPLPLPPDVRALLPEDTYLESLLIELGWS